MKLDLNPGHAGDALDTYEARNNKITGATLKRTHCALTSNYAAVV